LPVAVLRYRAHNPGHAPAQVSVAFSIDNPVLNGATGMFANGGLQEKRVNEYRSDPSLNGLLMTNPGLAGDDPLHGSFVLGATPSPGLRLTYWRGWPQGSWWNSPLLFWDAFSKTGQMNNEPSERNKVGVLCQSRTILPGDSGDFTFLLAWHFPNRTPEWCGWSAPPGKEKTVIGNFYCTRFADAWEAAVYAARNLESLQQKTRAFAQALRESTLPAEVREAASANLSTLASTTCFRTADGEFHGFEGSNDRLGCCYGNCTHVWSYETATSFLFPSFARSLRKAAFGYSEDDEGGIHARQLLPDGEARDGIIATDGHMGQIMHAYLDWRLSGDNAWLAGLWPRVRQAIAFAWIADGWDPQKTGVTTGVQNNTYDVAFFGPNPLCSIYYLGALRAAEEMARAAGDNASALQYKSLFDQGRHWIEASLFNGEFFTQQIRRFSLDQIHPSLRVGASGFDPQDPQFQAGAGCLVDQLMGQYLASVMGLGPLISPEHLRATLRSIYRYNYKRTLVGHDNVERTFALNDEAAMVICDYGTAPRPHIPFPYFAEVMTGFEHATAALMIASGMQLEGVECIRNVRARYDGEKRNPWDEAECGHHYARAMASWSSVVILSGFDYDGQRGALTALPPACESNFRSFWSNGTGWGVFSFSGDGSATRFALTVITGTLSCRSCAIHGAGKTTVATHDGGSLSHSVESGAGATLFRFDRPLVMSKGDTLHLEVRG
jgi:non-lysosomal glucosylceramidase